MIPTHKIGDTFSWGGTYAATDAAGQPVDVSGATATAQLRTPSGRLIAAASGLLEPLGALLGVGLTGGLAAAYPAGLGLAAGAMIFVVSHEVIPETHRNGHQTPATLGLMAGFALMMVLDTTLG